MFKRIKAATPAAYKLGKFLWQNRKIEMAIGGTVVAGLTEIVRVLAGHA